MKSAVISDDLLYRYELRRTWGCDEEPLVCWVMLNPSTADADRDDHTIRRCISYSNRWGFGALVVVNLFAYRATSPVTLREVNDPVGPLNDASLLRAAIEADQVVCAWGNHGTYLNRGAKVTQLLTGPARLRLHCLAKSKDGNPKHPARLCDELRPVVYR